MNSNDSTTFSSYFPSSVFLRLAFSNSAVKKVRVALDDNAILRSFHLPSTGPVRVIPLNTCLSGAEVVRKGKRKSCENKFETSEQTSFFFA